MGEHSKAQNAHLQTLCAQALEQFERDEQTFEELAGLPQAGACT